MPPRKPKNTEPDDSADQRAAAAAADAPKEEAPKPDPEMTAEEYMKHRAEVLARLPAEDDRPKNIYARLAQINGLIGLIRKTGVNDFHHYTYAKEADLVEEVRPMLAEYGIWLEQSLVSDDDGIALVPHQRLGVYKSRDNITVESLTAITKRFRFVWWNPAGGGGNPPKGELETTEWVYFMGYGDDTGDKGYYKAETGAVKYFLMKSFMVATGNDPEADSAVDRRAAQRDSGGGPRVTGGGGRAPAQPGGRQQNASAPQLRQIGELLRAVGAKQSHQAIAKLEAITGDTVPIADPEDLGGAIGAYIASLPGPKVGAIIQKLREEATAGDTKPDEGAAPAEAGGTPTDAKAEGSKPAAAGYTEDEEAPVAETKVWSEQGDDTADPVADDAADDGTIPSAIG